MYSRKLLRAWFASSSSHHPQARESGGTQLKSPGTRRSIIILSFGLLSLTKIRTITITGVFSLGTRCLNEVLQQIVEKTKTDVWKYLYRIHNYFARNPIEQERIRSPLFSARPKQTLASEPGSRLPVLPGESPPGLFRGRPHRAAGRGPCVGSGAEAGASGGAVTSRWPAAVNGPRLSPRKTLVVARHSPQPGRRLRRGAARCGAAQHARPPCAAAPAVLPLTSRRRRADPSLPGTLLLGSGRQPAPLWRRTAPPPIGRGAARVTATAAAIGRRASPVSRATGRAAGGGRLPPWRACTRASTSTR